ncbi:tRNA-binding protein [Pseudomonas sp. NS1(2017)]|jgi:tRNA-binding protein|uniref:tRNA-binding protein n=1 Tax=Pseudomonas reactans TaxID=117680 RepID=A0ABX2QYT5_9PSED|nr:MULTISPECIES: tRNA-binding protein [Pseudomonas]ASV38101.1 tRNA-binding protein [Pseudomonas sp. NS1(2017)]NWA41132.1 tRNA-binding protein [Pseudomonas reactans]NWC89705.1 tRNA-binding protein [Pseudomonas reactans]NWD31956.1 tRNA-binding protein [Pseudomonas reactans]NWD96510.1 tRNA-binding protein [Pseudomonas reactans]
MTPYEAFSSIDIRIGQVTNVELNEKAKKPAYKVWIDFGELGIKTTSAQFTQLYTAEALIGEYVVCVVNLGTRNIAGFASEVLMLGAQTAPGEVVFLKPERALTPGQPVF